MKIRRIQIKNFRSIKEQTIDCDQQTIFTGANGTGKSTILKALQVFFDLKFKPDIEDYFAHNPKEPIEITVVFANFSEQEQNDFQSRIHNCELSVIRSFGGASSEDGNFHSLVQGCVDFQPVRQAKNATERRAEYNKVIEAGYELPSWKNQAAAEEALANWENENPGKCQFIKDGGQFFGFKSVGGGKLQNAANFIMIEAVRDVSEDASDQKTSAIGQLMDLIVRSAMMQNAKIAKYQEEVNKEYAELTSPDQFPQLGSLETALTDSLKTYYQDVGVRLNWRETSGIVLPPPQAEIKFQEDEFEYPVSKAGNGVQRAFIISLLHQLLVAKSNSDEAKSNEDTSDTDGSSSDGSEPNLLEKLPSVILAIEEPELYQHPAKQWHFAQVLKKLSSGQLKDTFGDVQVLYCTHSPNFVNLDDFHNVRIVGKETCETTKIKYTVSRGASLSAVSRLIEAAWEFDEGTCTNESTLARLHIFGIELSEGFFSDGVILVEGVTDKVALELIAEYKEKSFVRNNLSVLPVGGKGNIDRPWMIFTQLGIPVYPVWDNDANCSDGDKHNTIKTNKALQRMIGLPEPEISDFPKGIFGSFSCMDNDLNHQIKAEFGVTEFDAALLKARDKFTLNKEQARKNPYVIAEIIRTLYNDGKKSTTLEAIIDAAFAHCCPKSGEE